jgi:hypothetical protein
MSPSPSLSSPSLSIVLGAELIEGWDIAIVSLCVPATLLALDDMVIEAFFAASAHSSSWHLAAMAKPVCCRSN